MSSWCNTRSVAGPRDLSIRLLGGFSVDGIRTAALGSRKGRTLLKRLVVARGPVATDALVDTLSPEGPPANPAEQVSVLASRLRRVLGAARITFTDGVYTAHIDWLDVDALAERTARRPLGGSPRGHLRRRGRRSSRRASGPSTPGSRAGRSSRSPPPRTFPGRGYALVCIFDALHDMPDPLGAAGHIRDSLADDGTFMLVEPYANDNVEDNLNRSAGCTTPPRR